VFESALSLRSILCWVPLVLLVACHRGPPAPPDAGPPAVGSAPIVVSSASAISSASQAPPVAVSVPLPPPASSGTFPVFRRTTMPIEEVTKLVTASPELARVGAEISFFDPGDGSYIVRSSADHAGVAFTTQPLIWSPEAGQQGLVVGARGKTASFVAAWWLLPDGGYRLASSFVMLGEVAPVALAYRPAEHTLYWTSCWLCPGESGHLSVREDHHIVIVEE